MGANGKTAATDMKHIAIGGQCMPSLGFGTYELNGATCRHAVEAALATGYRHIDTASMYGNEGEVGRALRSSSVPRNEVFVTTKVWFDRLHRRGVLRSCERSLELLGSDYVDLLLVHWPNPEVPLEETLGAMDEVVASGKARAIGVSNFPPRMMREARKLANVVCDQVEYHPYLAQSDILGVARSLDIAVTAYCPLAQGEVVDDPTLREIGRRHDKSSAQVAIRWLVQQEMVAAIPRAGNPDHIQENFEVFDFSLTREERRAVANLSRAQRIIDPEFAPEW